MLTHPTMLLSDPYHCFKPASSCGSSVFFFNIIYLSIARFSQSAAVTYNNSLFVFVMEIYCVSREAGTRLLYISLQRPSIIPHIIIYLTVGHVIAILCISATRPHDLISLVIFGEKYRRLSLSWSSFLQLSLHSPRSICFPQRLVGNSLRYVFVLYGDTPRITSLHACNSRQNHIRNL